MGGKLWSPAEEAFFWKEVVPFSNKRVGPDKINNNQRSWKELAVMMQEKMGDEALRDYTHISLMEHWFKNVQEQRYSKHALEYVLAYKELMIDGEFGAGRKPRRSKVETGGVDQEDKGMGDELMGDEDVEDEIMEDDDVEENDADMDRERRNDTPFPVYDASPIQSAAVSPAPSSTPAPAAPPVPPVSFHNPFSAPLAQPAPTQPTQAGAPRHSPAFPRNILPPINGANGHFLPIRGNILPPINRVDGSFHAFQQLAGNVNPGHGNHDYANHRNGSHGYGNNGNGSNRGFGFGFGDPGGLSQGNYHGYANGSNNPYGNGASHARGPNIAPRSNGYGDDSDSDNDNVHDINPGNPHVPPSYESHSFADENTGRRNTPGQRPVFGVGPRVPPSIQSMVDRAVTSSVVRLLGVGFRVNDFGEYNLAPPVPAVQPWARNYLAEQEALRVGILAVEPSRMVPRTPPVGAPSQVAPEAEMLVPSIEADGDQQPPTAGHRAPAAAGPLGHLDPNLVAASNALIGLLQAPVANQVAQHVVVPEIDEADVDPDASEREE